jgi:cell division protein FtsB
MRRVVWAIAAVVALAVGMFLFGYPTRTYLDQRAALAQEQSTAFALASQNQTLRSEAAKLQTPAEVQQLARQQYGLVEPGQEAYAILPAPAGSRASEPGTKKLSTPTRNPALNSGRSTASGSSTSHQQKSSAGSSALAGGAGGGSLAPKSGLWSHIVHQLEFWD